MKHCLFYQDDKSNKFWEVEVKGKEMVVRYGKIATDGQVTVKKFSSASDAETAAEKAMAEKIKKGYHLKGDEKSDEVLVSTGIATLARRYAVNFLRDPRNKAHVEEDLLLKSVSEELGKKTSPKALRSVVKKFINGGMSEKDEQLYDAAIYVCALIANQVWANNPEDEEEDVDYSIDWIENPDDSVCAVVRPT
jgi:predicted DNA-binding WGR domain protein